MNLPLPDEMVRALRAMRPALDRAVIVGGWAHRLHAEHPRAMPTFEPLTTTDCDVALPLEWTVPAGVDLQKELEREGFRLELGGGEAGEHRRYVLGTSPVFYVQFLTRRHGDTRRSEPVELGGVLAEPLRFMDIALRSPWEVVLELPDGERLATRVVAPMAFLVGKLLVSDQASRGAEGRAKDLLSVVDTLRMFESELDELRPEAAAVWGGMSKQQRRRLRSSLRNHLAGTGSDTLHRAAAIGEEAGGGRPRTAEEVRNTLRYGVVLLWDRDLLP